MKGLRNKKGFTLIELLAVIVVLAIVMVLATTTVLPYMGKAANKALATEANGVIDAASQAITLMSIGTISEPTAGADYKKTEVKDGSGNVTSTTYCFSLKQLVDLGLWTKDKEDVAPTSGDPIYSGTVVATKTAGSNAYTYNIQMKNETLYVTKTGGTVKEDDVSSTATTIKTSCAS